MKLLSKIISVIFHPLLMASYMVGVFYFYLPELFGPISRESLPMFILAVFITTFVIPVISLVLLKISSHISSIDLNDREERKLPFLSILIFYGVATYLFIYKLNIGKPISTMMILVTILLAFILLITLKYKISAHVTAIWGAIGFITALFWQVTEPGLLVPLIAGIFAAGLTGTSRLYLNKHTSSEVWSGALLGFCICFFGQILLA